METRRPHSEHDDANMATVYDDMTGREIVRGLILAAFCVIGLSKVGYYFFPEDRPSKRIS